MIAVVLFLGGFFVMLLTALLYRREKTSVMGVVIPLLCFVAVLVGFSMILKGW